MNTEANFRWRRFSEFGRQNLAILTRAKASTTLDFFSQVIDASKLAAQRDIALATMRSTPADQATLQVKNYR
jgi:hypothetical protein